jgi:hypothetical protein
MALPVAMDTALRGAVATGVMLVKIELPGRTLRYINGSAELLHEGEIYSGEDATFGLLGAIEPVPESVGTEAPRLQIVLHPRSNTAMAEVTSPLAQGSPVTIWFGVINPATGTVTATDPLFVGELDTAQISIGEGSKALTLDVASAWERLFQANEGAKLNDPFWQALHPGDLSMQYVPVIQRQLPWGSDGPRPALITDVGPGISNGGGGGGGYGYDAPFTYD